MFIYYYKVTIFQLIENKNKLEKAAFILKTVAHPTRLAIIVLLDEHKTLSVSAMCEILGCEQSLLSHHLISMKLRGLLNSDKSGQSVHYYLKENAIKGLINCIEGCECSM